jgi:hypothetical protein
MPPALGASLRFTDPATPPDIPEFLDSNSGDRRPIIKLSGIEGGGLPLC